MCKVPEVSENTAERSTLPWGRVHGLLLFVFRSYFIGTNIIVLCLEQELFGD